MTQPQVVYVPFKAGLPPMRAYLRSLWHRRAFVSEFARSELREQNFGSVFGQLWLVLNPLLLSGVYFLLIYVIGGTSDAQRFGHLTATLFLFYLIANSLTGGVKAITSGQRLILNTSFPRIMLPVSAVVVAIFRFIPTLVVAFAIHAILGLPYSWQMLWAIPVLFIAIVMGLGMAILISCINASKISADSKRYEVLTPIFYLPDSWSRVMVHAQAPHPRALLHATLFALTIFIVGTYFFLSRERDFAVRL